MPEHGRSQFAGLGSLYLHGLGHLMEVLRQAGFVYPELLKPLCVWQKSAVAWYDVPLQHELVLVFKNGEANPRHNVQLAAYGRKRTNVWRYPGLNTFQSGRAEALAMHPRQTCSARRDAILDAGPEQHCS
jgi:hypothetical protein